MREVREQWDGGPQGIAENVAEKASRLVFEDDELLISLANTLKIHEYEQTTLWARIRAWLGSPMNSETIEVDGMRMQQLYVLAGSKPPAPIKLTMLYAVNTAVFRELLRKAKRDLNRRANAPSLSAD